MVVWLGDRVLESVFFGSVGIGVSGSIYFGSFRVLGLEAGGSLCLCSYW